MSLLSAPLKRKARYKSVIWCSLVPVNQLVVKHEEKLCDNAFWCGRSDSNRHSLRSGNLNAVRLPVPPRPRSGSYSVNRGRRQHKSYDRLKYRFRRGSDAWAALDVEH
jgi:hypothetical protein